MSDRKRESYTREALGQGRFTSVPNDLISDTSLTPQERMTWITIAQHQWGSREASWPGVPRIAHFLGVHEQTARGYIHSLRDKGFLSVTERPGYTNVYELFYTAGNPDGATTPSLQATPSLQTSPTPSPQARPPLAPRLGEEYKEEDKGKKTYPSDFEEFWQTYPRKIGKAAACSKWRALIKRNGAGPGIATLLVAAKHYRQTCEASGTEETYRMHPETFLNKERWADYVEPPKAAGKPPGNERLDEVRRQVRAIDAELVVLNSQLRVGGSEEELSRHDELVTRRERLVEEGMALKEAR